MTGHYLRIMLLIGLLIASVAAPGSLVDAAHFHHQPMPCGPECAP
jgi:hypothetical protein